MKSLCIALAIAGITSTADAQTAGIVSIAPEDGEIIEVDPVTGTAPLVHGAFMNFENPNSNSSALFSYRLTLRSQATGKIAHDSGWVDLGVSPEDSTLIDYSGELGVPVGVWYWRCQLAEGYGGGVPTSPLLDDETSRYRVVEE